MIYKRAFTLIELLVVVAIIGVLASVILANLSGARDKAKSAAINSEVKEWFNALNIFYSDNGYFFETPPFSSICLGGTLPCQISNGTPVGPTSSAAFNSLMNPYIKGTPNPNTDYIAITSTLLAKATYYSNYNQIVNGQHGVELTWSLYGNTKCALGSMGAQQILNANGTTTCIYDLWY